MLKRTQKENNKIKCLSPWKKLYIGEYLTVMPGCQCETNISNKNNLWNGNSMLVFRENMIENKSKQENTKIQKHCFKFYKICKINLKRNKLI